MLLEGAEVRVQMMNAQKLPTSRGINMLLHVFALWINFCNMFRGIHRTNMQALAIPSLQFVTGNPAYFNFYENLEKAMY